MSDEELSQALKDLASEFGAQYSVYSYVNKEGLVAGSLAAIDVNGRMIQVNIASPRLSAIVLTLSGVESSSGHTDIIHPETILAWLRAKLLELTRGERERYFHTMIECLVNQEDPNVVACATGELYAMMFGAWKMTSAFAMNDETQPSKLAFGGDQ